jgi:hypothetical protein
MSKIYGSVIKRNSNNERWYILCEGDILKVELTKITVLDSNFKILGTMVPFRGCTHIGKVEPVYKLDDENILEIDYYGNKWGNLLLCNVVYIDGNLDDIQTTFKTNLEKYDYQQINNYFCKIPKTISTYYQDTEKETYHHSYFLLQNLHDTRIIIFKFLLELKRVDYDGYKKIDI